MVLIDDEIILIDAAKEYLTFFLEKQGTFYPFAMIMDAKGITYPLEREITEEHPSPQSLIRVYEQTFHNELKKNYILGILCIDVYVSTQNNEINIKRDAIEFRLFGKNYNKKILLFYKISNGRKILYQELIGNE